MAVSLPILTFHALDDRSSAILFAPRVFQRGLARLQESGYRALRLLEAADGLRHGEPFPDRAFVLTFDDGYQSVYTEVFPVLQHYGWSATVFLTVGQNRKVCVESRLPAMEDRPMLAWREIQEMHRWEPGECVYNRPIVFRFTGLSATTRLDVEEARQIEERLRGLGYIE